MKGELNDVCGTQGRDHSPPAHPDGCLVAVDPGDGEPGGQLQHILQHLLIQLQVGQLPLPLQGAQVDFVWREILGEPTGEERRGSKTKAKRSC